MRAPYNRRLRNGRVVELVDTQHSKCCAFGRVGSSPTSATIYNVFLYFLAIPSDYRQGTRVTLWSGIMGSSDNHQESDS